MPIITRKLLLEQKIIGLRQAVVQLGEGPQINIFDEPLTDKDWLETVEKEAKQILGILALTDEEIAAMNEEE